MAHVYPQGPSFLLLLIVISACKATSPVTVTVSAYKEEDAKVPCFNSTVTDPKSCYRVKLVKYDDKYDDGQIVIFAWPKKNLDAKRVKWELDGDGQMSLYLTKVRKSDEGLYSCEVCQGWECALFKNISLKVKDCKASPAVRAAPSTVIKLICPVSEQQNISWAMLKGGNPVSVNLSLNRIEINGASLVINSVNTSDSGWYRCQHMLGPTQRCFDINLLVQVENFVKTTTVPVIATTTQQALTTSDSAKANSREESNEALIAVVASVIIGIVLTAALIGLFFYCRHNDLRVTQQTQRRSAGAVRQSLDGYEIVNLTQDSSIQQVNSLYQQYEDGNMCTFQR